jgi:L,D-transpeptidase ErfK/SrfK
MRNVSNGANYRVGATRKIVGPLLWVIVCAWAASAAAEELQKYTEADFYLKNRMFPPYVVVSSSDSGTARSIVGNTRFYQVRKGDTFLDLARFYGLGYNEIELANPGVDPWVPPDGQTVVLPTEWVLPQAAYMGVVINIPEMRVYYFHPKNKTGPQLVSTYPVGLGRDDWRTPQGKFKIIGKTENPIWIIPESIRKERIREKGFSEEQVAGGDPENPLGKYRLELSMPDYRIHGTNIPWGVGMQVSHGCVRLYPEDIQQLYGMVRVGDPGEFVYQPVKVGARAGRIFVQVHPDIYRLTPGPYREARRILDELGWTNRVDLRRVQRAVEEQSGVPLDVTAGARASDEMPEEVLHPAMDLPPRASGVPHPG